MNSSVENANSTFEPVRGEGRPIKILGIGGSTRASSSAERALAFAAAQARLAGADVELFVGRRLMFPIFDTETAERTDDVLEFLAAVRRADALIVAAPGYHGALSGMIKNALDYLEDLRTDASVYLDGMAVGCIAVASGWQATTSTLQSLRQVVHALRGWPTPLGVAINSSVTRFCDDGRPDDESAASQLRTVGEQVVEFARRHAATVGS
jgi:FMN reductase